LPRKRLLVAGAVAALVIAVAAAVIGSKLISAPDASKPSAEDKSRGFVEFRDPRAGFSISHPRSWRRLPSADGQVRLIVAGGGASLLVRTSSLGLRVRPETLSSAKKLTDRLVRAVKNVKLLRRAKQVQVGGLPGYLYLYTFRDIASGQRGAHAHYFLFRGETMFTLVFQALPATSFGGFAPLFDRITNTFQAQPEASGQR
jgi:hypothetical protein